MARRARADTDDIGKADLNIGEVMKKPISVLLTTEGTYPYFEGGVSTWCDVLIRQLTDVNFTLLSLTAQPGLQPAYQLPANVSRHLPLPLWGTGGANELRYEVGWGDLHRMRGRLGQRVSRTAFAQAFDMLLTGLLSKHGTIEQVGEGLRRMALFFETHDYDATFRDHMAWDVFQSHVAGCAEALVFDQRDIGAVRPTHDLGRPSLLETAEALRLLYRWLTPIALPIPKVSLVHASAAGLASLPGIIAKLQHGTPLLLTEHGVYLRERYLAWAGTQASPFVKLFATRVTRRLVELTYATADLIAPVSSWNVRWEQRLGAMPDRILTIANGVDPQRFAPQPMPDADQPTLVWVGRIDPLKDLLTLIDAAALLRAAIPNARVLLFGKAPQGNEAYDAACRARVRELGLEVAVQFMGFAKSPQDAYAQGHVAVLSSISEALPFSVIEAMFCGRPVVGTGVGGVPEVIGDTGRVVLPRDPQGLAAACVELLSAPQECATLGQRARARALENYTLQRSVSAYHAAYQRLAARAAPVITYAPAAEPARRGLLSDVLNGLKPWRNTYEPGIG
jgi:glycosyltransferase involved in cell wall biosynthesis